MCLAQEGDAPAKFMRYKNMLPISIAVIVLLNLLSSYTFIHILLGTAIACVLARLVVRRHVRNYPGSHACDC